MGLRFEVIVSGVLEELGPDEPASVYVERLAHEKAMAVARLHPDGWIIAADTIVYLDGSILEKPRDPEDAVRMLEAIAGRSHTVYTGVVLQNLADGVLSFELCKSDVTMLPLTREEIEWYVGTGEPLDKAGSYAVQGIGSMFIESIRGSYTNVVGLPLATLYTMMKNAGIQLDSWRVK